MTKHFLTYPKTVSCLQKATFDILVHLREECNKLQVLVERRNYYKNIKKFTCDDVVES